LLPFTLAEAKHSFCTAILVRRSSSSIQVTHKLFINECVSHTPELSISASWMFFMFFQTPTVLMDGFSSYLLRSSICGNGHICLMKCTTHKLTNCC
jgi:hypothetical protein